MHCSKSWAFLKQGSLLRDFGTFQRAFLEMISPFFLENKTSEAKALKLLDGLFSISHDAWLTASAVPNPPHIATSGADCSGILAAAGLENLPVITWGPHHPIQLYKIAANHVQLNLDVFGVVFYMLTRYEPTDSPQNRIVAFLRTMYGDKVLNAPMLKSTAISDAGLTKQTLYEVERSAFTRTTYDRAIESLNAVNDEIAQLIQKTWGR